MPATGGITPASMDRLLASPSRASAAIAATTIATIGTTATNIAVRASATIAAITIATIGTTATNIAVAIELRRRRGILRQRLTRSRPRDRALAVEDIAVGPPPPEAPVTAEAGPAAGTVDGQRRNAARSWGRRLRR